MPKTYERLAAGGHKIYERLAAMRDRFHAPLTEAGVAIDVLLVHAARDQNDEPKGSALDHNGYPAAAVVKILSLEQRVAGRGDAEMVIDGDKWDEWSDAELDSLLDHELEHLELVIDKDGAVVRDDADRPKLKMRRHDWQHGGFYSIAKRHKEDAFEVQAVTAVAKEFVVQGVLNGF